ncbi:MAG: hypothetical protein HWN66_17295 [Candidatus Helarchaeota archaeon]|nr:hypothetical protein [Candidatus Helarchaeota archaeon]
MASVTEKPSMVKIIMESLKEMGIQITEGEARAFVALYGKGFITASSIAAMANITFEEAQISVKKFLTGQLAVETKEIVKGLSRYMPTVPWSAFTQYLDSFRNKTATSREELDGHVKGHISTLQSEVINLKDAVAKAVSTQIEKFAQDTVKARESISKTITEHIMKLNSDVEKKKEEISVAFKEKNDAHNANIHEYEQTLSAALDKKYDLLTNQTKEIHDKVSNDHNEALNLMNIKIDGSFDKYVAGVKEIINSNRNDVYNAYDQWHTDLSAEFLKRIDKQIAIVRDKDGVLKEEISKSIETNFDWFKDRARLMRTRAAETFNKEIETQESEFYKLKNSIAGVTSDLLARMKGTLQEIQDNFLQRIENQVKRLHADSTVLEKKLSETIDEKIAGLTQNCSSLKQSFITDIDSRLGSLTEQIKKVEKEMVSSLSNIVSDHKSDVKTLSKTEQGTIKDIVGGTKSTVSDLIKELENELREWGRSVEDNLKEKVGANETLKETVNMAIQDLNAIRKLQKTKLDDLTNKLNENMNQMVDTLNTNMDNYVQSNTQKFDAWFSTTEASTKNVIDTETAAVSARCNEMKNTAITIADSNLQWFKDNQSVLGDAAATLFNSQIEATDLEFYSLKDSISSGMDDLVKRFKDISNQIQDRFLDTVLAQVNRLQTDTATLEKTLSETLDERTDTYRNELDTMRDDFYKVVAERVDDLDGRAHDLRTETINLLSEIIQTHKTNLQNIDDTKFGELDSTTDTMKQEVSGAVNIEIERANKMITDTQDTVSARVNEGFSTIKQEINEIDTDYLKQIQDLTKATADQVNEIASNHAAGFQTDATDMEKTLLELATQHQADYETNANTLNENFASKSDETETVITNRLNTANNDMAKVFRESEARTLERSQLLRAVWKELTNVLPIQGVLTWPLVTHDAIVEYIKDMLVRTKSTVSVIAPSFDDLPFDALMQTPSTRRVIIATKILATQRERVQQMLDKGNIQIRQRPESDIFACARDGEEILIAPIYEGIKPEEFVAIVSQQDGFAKQFHELMGPMWMSRAQKITRV